MLSKTLSAAKYRISSSTVIQMKNIKTLVPRAKWQVIEHQKMAAETPLEGRRVKFNRFHFLLKGKVIELTIFPTHFQYQKETLFSTNKDLFLLKISWNNIFGLLQAISLSMMRKIYIILRWKGGDQRTEIVLATTALVAVVALFLRSPPSSANN